MLMIAIADSDKWDDKCQWVDNNVALEVLKDPAEDPKVEAPAAKRDKAEAKVAKRAKVMNDAIEQIHDDWIELIIETNQNILNSWDIIIEYHFLKV